MTSHTQSTSLQQPKRSISPINSSTKTNIHFNPQINCENQFSYSHSNNDSGVSISSSNSPSSSYSYVSSSILSNSTNNSSISLLSSSFQKSQFQSTPNNKSNQIVKCNFHSILDLAQSSCVNFSNQSSKGNISLKNYYFKLFYYYIFLF